jgi:hypothetical protein
MNAICSQDELTMNDAGCPTPQAALEQANSEGWALPGRHASTASIALWQHHTTDPRQQPLDEWRLPQ